MLLDLINFEKIRRAVLYLLVLLAVFFLQNIVLSHVFILGVRPMIIPIAVVAIGFFTSGVWGGVFGVLAGIFTDMVLGGNSVMMTVLFPVIGFFSGVLPMFFMSRSLPSFLSLSTLALALTAFAQLFRYLVFYGVDPAPLLYTALFQVLWSLPFIFVVFYPCRVFSRLKLTS